VIVKLAGVIEEVDVQAVTLGRDGLAYEVLVPAYALAEMAARRGQPAALFTQEFLEGNAGTGQFVPRIIGFPRSADRAFFNRFVEVKGIGPRKALKALSEPVATIARWITAGDTKALTRLPGIGARAAQMIVAELQGKVEEFAAVSAAGSEETTRWTAAQRDALEVMVGWGDSRAEAMRWLERGAELHPDLQEAEEWVRACYRIKTGAER
jgi:Holliday junction DNA helicase RuvA